MSSFFQYILGIGMDSAVAEDGHHHHHHHGSLAEHRGHCKAKHGNCPYEKRERRDQNADDLGSPSPARRYMDDLNRRHDEENKWKKKYMKLKAKMMKRMAYSSGGSSSNSSSCGGSRPRTVTSSSCGGGYGYGTGSSC